MADDNGLKITPTDLSAYEVFHVSDARRNHVTIAVKGTLHPATKLDGHPRYSIHLLIWGDYGPFEHYWSHAGSAGEKWWAWLEDTDQDYFLKKITSGNHMEFDGEATLREARRRIIEYRKASHIDRNAARDAWSELDQIGEDDSPELMISALGDIPAFRDDYYEMGQERLKPGLAYLCEHIWGPFIKQMNATRCPDDIAA